MKLIATKCPASHKSDLLAFVREDGTRCEVGMPRQGVLPHDLIHYVVEEGLRLRGGFLGMVHDGADTGFVIEMAHGPKNREGDSAAIAVEAMVEALQTQLWAGAFDHDAFVYGLQTAAAARGVSPPAPPPEALGRMLFQKAAELHEKWTLVPVHSTMELNFARQWA